MLERQRIIAALAVVLLVTACSGDGGAATTAIGDATTPVSDAPPPTAPAATSEAPAAGEDRSEELIGRWGVELYALPDGGGLTNVVGDTPVFVEFRPDGTLEYHTGCNAGGTTYATDGTYLVPESALDDTPEGQPITLGPSFEQTEQGCDGFLGDQDVDLPANMAAATRFRLDEGRLLLLDEFLLIEATRLP